VDRWVASFSREEVVVEPGQTRFPNPLKTTVELSARMIVLRDANSRPCCPHCGASHALDLHQPVDTAPDELLATCSNCRRWYFLIEVSEESQEVLMVELPREKLLEKLFHKQFAHPR
jgi:hypothetical protein